MLCWNDGVAAFPKKWFNFSAFILEGRAARHCSSLAVQTHEPAQGCSSLCWVCAVSPHGVLGGRSCWHFDILPVFLCTGGYEYPAPPPYSYRETTIVEEPGEQGWERERGLVWTSSERVGGFWPNHSIINWKISTEMSEDKLRGLRVWLSSISQSTQILIKRKIKNKPKRHKIRAFRTNNFRACAPVLVTFMEVEKLKGDAEERLWRAATNTSYRRRHPF